MSKIIGLTRAQAVRAYRRLHAQVTEGYGYQPFGFDVPTMKINHPGYFPAKARLRRELIAAIEREEAQQ